MAAENPEIRRARAKQFIERWRRLAEDATTDQKEKAGLAYISLFLGLGNDLARSFAAGDGNAHYEVGMKQGAIPTDTDVSPFWNEIAKIFPGLHSAEEIEYLASPGGVFAVFRFMDELEKPSRNYSPLLRELSANAHAYK